MNAIRFVGNFVEGFVLALAGHVGRIIAWVLFIAAAAALLGLPQGWALVVLCVAANTFGRILYPESQQ